MQDSPASSASFTHSMDDSGSRQDEEQISSWNNRQSLTPDSGTASPVLSGVQNENRSPTQSPTHTASFEYAASSLSKHALASPTSVKGAGSKTDIEGKNPRESVESTPATNRVRKTEKEISFAVEQETEKLLDKDWVDGKAGFNYVFLSSDIFLEFPDFIENLDQTFFPIR